MPFLIRPLAFLLITSFCFSQTLKSKLTEFKSHIVHLDLSHDHESFERNLINYLTTVKQQFLDFKEDNVKISHRYHHVFHGLTVRGLSLEHLSNIPGVVRVVPDTVKRIVQYSWGLDRIDQRSLPLDQKYTPTYTGKRMPPPCG